jgi:hypothetical protein
MIILEDSNLLLECEYYLNEFFSDGCDQSDHEFIGFGGEKTCLIGPDNRSYCS